jgi:peroxiredoxin
MRTTNWIIWMLVLVVLLAGQGLGQETEAVAATGSRSHDYASLRNVDLELDNFEVQTLDGRKVRISELVMDGKIVLLHFFATFCHNSNYDIVTVNDLYRTYGAEGFKVIGISEYSTAAELEKFLGRHKPGYTMVTEEETGRKRTRHYRFRTKAGDERKWGTPLSIVIDGREIEPEGGTLARRMYVATGELVRAEIESLVRRRLKE